MKRRTRNDKVLRAITIGLATMIAATSAPITVLADENENNDPIEGGETKEQTTASEEPATVTEAVDTCQTAVTDANTADVSIDEALTAVEGIEGANAPAFTYDIVTEGADGSKTVTELSSSQADITTDLTAAAASVEAVEANLTKDLSVVFSTTDPTAPAAEAKTAQTHLNDAKTAETEATTKVTEAQNNAGSVDGQLTTFENASGQSVAASNAAISNANTANTSDSQEEAVAAQASAQANLSNAEAKLNEAETAYNNASQAVTDAEQELEDAEKLYQKAQDELNATKKQLGDAKDNATAAHEQLKAAQAKVDSLENKVNKISENKQRLEKIQEQYYALMVMYLRSTGSEDLDGDGTKETQYKKITDYDKNGVLNIESTVYTYNDTYKNNTRTDYFAKNNGSFVAISRYLTVKLVENMLVSEGVDPDTISFGTGGTAQAGTVFKNSVGTGYDETYVGDNSDNKKKDRYGNVIAAGEKIDVNWTRKQDNIDGRMNYLTVTITDKETGKETNKYYNYVFKSSKYNDDCDLENGVFYLAEIEFDKDGNRSSSRVVNAFNYDNYGKLTQELADLNNKADEYKNKLEAAKSAVSTAEKNVATLEDEINKLQNITVTKVDPTIIEDLQKKLANAREDLKAAEDNKKAMEGKYAEAKAAVDGIDLSRFNQAEPPFTPETGDPAVVADDDAGEVTYATASDAVRESVDAALEALGLPAMTTPAAPIVTPTFTAGTGAGAGTGTGAAAADQGVLGVREDDPATTVKPVAQKQDGVQQLKKLADEVLPLSDTPFDLSDPTDPSQIPWWWLVVIAILGAAGIKAYNDYKKKQEAKQQADK